MSHHHPQSSSNSSHRIKSSAYKSPGNFHSLLSSRNLTPLLLHCIHIHIEQSRGHDTPLPHTIIYPRELTFTPFILTQTELSTYTLLIPLNRLGPTSYIFKICHRTSLFTSSYAFSRSIKLTYTTPFLL